jgi:hypothetical protein
MTDLYRPVVSLVAQRFGVSPEEVWAHLGPLVRQLAGKPDTVRQLKTYQGLALETCWGEVLRDFRTTGPVMVGQQ